MCPSIAVSWPMMFDSRCFSTTFVHEHLVRQSDELADPSAWHCVLMLLMLLLLCAGQAG
jgi:hypothetical protein